MPDEQQHDEPISEGDGHFDVSTRGARAMLSQAVSNGWPIPNKAKAAAVNSLINMLAEANSKKQIRNVASIVRTLAVLNAQNQADVHLQTKHQVTVEERDYELPDESASIKVMFPTRGPQSAARPAAEPDDDRGADDA